MNITKFACKKAALKGIEYAFLSSLIFLLFGMVVNTMAVKQQIFSDFSFFAFPLYFFSAIMFVSNSFKLKSSLNLMFIQAKNRVEIFKFILTMYSVYTVVYVLTLLLIFILGSSYSFYKGREFEFIWPLIVAGSTQVLPIFMVGVTFICIRLLLPPLYAFASIIFIEALSGTNFDYFKDKGFSFPLHHIFRMPIHSADMMEVWYIWFPKMLLLLFFIYMAISYYRKNRRYI